LATPRSASLEVAKPPPWPTGVVWLPPRQNPQIFLLPILPLRVAESPPSQMGLVGHPHVAQKGATPKIIIFFLKKKKKAFKFFLKKYIMATCRILNGTTWR
jgi:hypothetical protein